MEQDQPATLPEILATLKEKGYRCITIQTSSPELPWIVFRVPTLGELSGYTFQASQAEVGPLMAMVGLSRILTLAASHEVRDVIELKPFVIMRAVQALLAELGLAAKAEKKSP